MSFKAARGIKHKKMPARQVIQMQHHVQLKPTFSTACTIIRVIRSVMSKQLLLKV